MATERNRKNDFVQEEQVVRIPLSEIHPFKGYPAMQLDIPFNGQPYKVRDDDPSMLELIVRVEERGVREPIVVRPDPEGGYELISGERRHRASKMAGREDIPAIVRDMSDHEAVIELVDANIHRENVLPSERAWAYRMKYEAMKQQGKRSDLTSPKNSAKSRTDDEIGEQMGISGDTLLNYISLTKLIPELAQMVDSKKMALSPAYHIAALKPNEQQMLIITMDYEQATPSLSQAQRLKKASQAGELNEDFILAIMSEEKKGDGNKLVLPADTLRKYFPKNYSHQRMQDTIIKLLDVWQKTRQQKK